MEEIFKQYGQPIIIVSVIVALIAIFALLLTTNDGEIYKQFTKLIGQLFEQAKFTPPSTIISGFLF